MKIIEYKIIQMNSGDSLSEQVNLSIADGFQPYGFMEAKGEYQHAYFIQAMVKYEIKE